MKAQSMMDISAAIEDGFVAYSAACVNMAGGEVHTSPDCTWMTCAYDLAYFNGVLKSRLPDTLAAETIIRLTTTFAGLRRRMSWWVTESSHPANLGALLESSGFFPAWSDVGMALELDKALPPPTMPADVTIAPVSDDRKLAVWCRTMAAAFDLRHGYRSAYERMLQSVALANHPLGPFYLARRDGQPIGTSVLYMLGEIAVINEVGVIPSARQQGIGAALTLAALQAARARGARVAVLGASPAGAPVYRRLGFQAYSTLQCYLRSPA